MTSLRLAIGTLALTFLAACTGTPTMQDKASAEFEGLNKVTSTGFNEVWGRPGAGLSDYRVIVATPLESADAEVVQPGSSVGSRVSSDWEVTPELQQGFAQAWNNSISRAADKAGLASDGSGDKVLRIDARLTRIAPSANFGEEFNTAGRSTVYTENSGDASIEITLRDQASGELLAVIRDKRQAGAQMWGRSNSVTASADVRNLFNGWANNLVNRITGS